MTDNRITKFFFLPFIIVAGNVVISSSFIENGAAQQPVDSQQSTEPLIVFINLQRIGTQLNLTEYSLNNGDLETAFEHAYVPHSVTFPVLKPILSETDSSLSKNLEGLLTDLPIKVRASATAEEAESNIKADIVTINDMLNTISNSTAEASADDSGFFLQASAVLLEDAVQSYQLSNASNTRSNSDIFNIQNSLGLINSSMANFERVANSIEEPRREEIRSFYGQMQEGIRNDIPFDTLA